jgi:flagellar motor switch protein FliN/FliY
MTQAPVADTEPQAAAAQPTVEVHDAQLPEAFDTGAKAPGGQMDILLETTIEISAWLGDARMPARDLLQLGPGAVVTLDRQAGEPVDLILNGIRFATGHVVVVGDQLGIRIKEVFACPSGGAAAS